jgi:hypothetical protein
MVAQNDSKTIPLTKQLKSLRAEAKRVGKRREYLQRLVDDGSLKAYRVGGTVDKPLLGVRPEDVDRAMLVEMQHVPPGKRRRRVSRPARPQKLDSAVRF